MASPRPETELLRIELPDEAATAALARALAALVVPGDVIALSGDLGAGKTSFARALINALPHPETGVPVAEEVPSPTFTLVQVYDREPAPVWHFDLYRLESPEEVVELGLEEALAEGIALIEWPDRLGPLRPAGILELAFHFGAGAGARWVELAAAPRWAERLAALRRDVPVMAS